MTPQLERGLSLRRSHPTGYQFFPGPLCRRVSLRRVSPGESGGAPHSRFEYEYEVLEDETDRGFNNVSTSTLFK